MAKSEGVTITYCGSDVTEQDLAWLEAKFRPKTCSVDGCLNPFIAKGLCKSHYSIRYWATNKERCTASFEAWSKKNDRREYHKNYRKMADKDARSERQARYRAKNKDLIAGLWQDWYKKNRRHRLLYTSGRSKVVARATPPWLTPEQLEQIRLVYANCPPGHHVDHIYPLRAKNSCGLHVPWNLQYLPAKENISKGNRPPD